MKDIDYTKPIIDCEDLKHLFAHHRYCNKCGGRYILRSEYDDITTFITIFRKSIVCPHCGESGTTEKYIRNEQLNEN